MEIVHVLGGIKDNYNHSQLRWWIKMESYNFIPVFLFPSNIGVRELGFLNVVPLKILLKESV